MSLDEVIIALLEAKEHCVDSNAPVKILLDGKYVATIETIDFDNGGVNINIKDNE